MKGTIKEYRLSRKNNKTIVGLTILLKNRSFHSGYDETIEALTTIILSLSPSSISIEKEYGDNKSLSNKELKDLVENICSLTDNHQIRRESLEELMRLAIDLDITLFLRLHGTVSMNGVVAAVNDNGDSYIYFETEKIDSAIIEILQKNLPDWRFC